MATVITLTVLCFAGPQHHAPLRVLPHIKKLDDAFGQFLGRVFYDCGACREIEPEALARVVSNPQGARATDALLEVLDEGRRGSRGVNPASSRSGFSALKRSLQLQRSSRALTSN